MKHEIYEGESLFWIQYDSLNLIAGYRYEATYRGVSLGILMQHLSDEWHKERYLKSISYIDALLDSEIYRNIKYSNNPVILSFLDNLA
jgi:hypothetical protein